MNRAVGARERSGEATIPGALLQADIKRAVGPKLIVTPQSLGTGAPATSLSPAFNHTLSQRRPWHRMAGVRFYSFFPASSNTAAVMAMTPVLMVGSGRGAN